MNQETVEERLDRLEYYIHLLRRYTLIDPDRFILWDCSPAFLLKGLRFCSIVVPLRGKQLRTRNMRELVLANLA